MKRAQTLVSAAKYSVGSKETPETTRMDGLPRSIEEKSGEIPYVDKLMEIKGVGLVNISEFIAEVEDVGHFDNPKQLQKLAGYAIVANDSGKHSGEGRISYRGGRGLRYMLYETAMSPIGESTESRTIHEYDRTHRENPLKRVRSVVVVICKTLGVFYTILTKGADYDPLRLMEDIKRPQMQAA